MRFKVKNLSAYRKAMYPSYTEPDKLDLSRYSFPFAKTAKLGAIATALISGLGSTSSANAEQPFAPKLFKEVKEVAMDPGAIYGDTIQIMTLSEKEVLPIVEKVFKDAGLNMQKHIQYKKGNVEFEIDLYDKDKDIGFEYVHYGDYEAYFNQPDKLLSNTELNIFENKNEKKDSNILIIRNTDSRFTPDIFNESEKRKALLRLEEAVRQYIKQLKEQGVL